MRFTTRGYIEVFKGSEYISRHRVETEAVESAFRNGPGDYTFVYPHKTVEVPDRDSLISYWGDDYWPSEGVGTQTENFTAGVTITFNAQVA